MKTILIEQINARRLPDGTEFIDLPKPYEVQVVQQSDPIIEPTLPIERLYGRQYTDKEGNPIFVIIHPGVVDTIEIPLDALDSKDDEIADWKGICEDHLERIGVLEDLLRQTKSSAAKSQDETKRWVDKTVQLNSRLTEIRVERDFLLIERNKYKNAGWFSRLLFLLTNKLWVDLWQSIAVNVRQSFPRSQ